MIWWLWTAFNLTISHIFDVNAAWEDKNPDVAWLGEDGWAARIDNMGIGLRGERTP
jgi:hypothetical protein